PQATAPEEIRTQTHIYAERRASVGESRAAREAGYRPAAAPTTSAPSVPAQRAAPGRDNVQLWVVAAISVAGTPSAGPASPPMPERISASVRNRAPTWRRVAPNARRSPISLRRSSTAMIMTLAIPTAPTTRAMLPKARKSPVSAPCVAARAARTSEGWLTVTWSGLAGLADAAMTDRTAATWLGTALT